MGKFRYRLAPLLKIRENIRSEKQAELAKAYQAAKIVEEQLERVNSEIAANADKGRQLLKQERLSVDSLLAFRRHEAYLLTQRNHAEGQLEQIKQEIERRRIALMEADREVKVLEKLREKAKLRHDHAEALADMKQMDEVAGRTNKLQQ